MSPAGANLKARASTALGKTARLEADSPTQGVSLRLVRREIARVGALESSDPLGCFYLGDMLWRGIGGERDTKFGTELLRESRALYVDEACQTMKKLGIRPR